MTSRRWLSFSASLALMAGSVGQAWSQAGSPPAAPSFSLELNNANDLNGACRLIFVATNNTEAVLEKTAYEVAVFDDQSRVSQILVLEFGRVAVGRTKVVQFDLAEQPCARISRLLINDIADCVVAGQASTVCIDALAASTRTQISFGV